MTSFFILLAIAFFLYRTHQRTRPAAIPTAAPVPRSQAQGDAGEALVQAELRRVLTWLCGADFYLHPGALLLNHAPGTAFPTAEVDHLAITPFGIFIIETKNWTGAISPGSDSASVVRTGADGRQEIRRSPLRQNRSKIAFLRAMLPAVWRVDGLGVFASDDCSLSADLPARLIRRSDLQQWLRQCRSDHEAAGRRKVNVSAARDAIRYVSVADPDGSAMEKHRSLVKFCEGLP